MHECGIDDDDENCLAEETLTKPRRDPVIGNLLTATLQLLNQCQDDPQSRHLTLLRLIGEMGAMRDLIEILADEHGADDKALREALAGFWSK